MRSFRRRLVVILFLRAVVFSSALPFESVYVTTALGTYRGRREASGIDMFLGIKYAPTPTRFEPAKPALSFVGVADATAFGDICFQDPHGVSLVSPNSTQSEDCLHYNIFRPQGANTPLPVLFWVHGGGFISGSGGDGDASDKSGAGSTLARRQKSIVVTINYRLGPLGFLVKWIRSAI